VQAEVVLNEGLSEDDTAIEEISVLCRESLASHKVPSRITVVDHLGVTSGGKLARPNG
jgi:acyl-coenzyme A synthetase/AMP-(fatty) acid ligase